MTRYRWLLRAYPRAYRSARGEELVGVLLDAAPAGRPIRVAANLVRHGLRARLGRPASRSVVTWAALTAVICGLFSAAAATRLAWETARPMPDRAETVALLAEVAPEHSFTDIQVAPALFTFYSQKVTRGDLPMILFPDGGEYEQGAGTANAYGAPPMPVTEAVTRAEERLRDSGWRVYPRLADGYESCTGKYCTDMVTITTVSVEARRGDTILGVTTTDPLIEPGWPYLTVTLRRATPPAALPAGVAGGLLGAALAWLLFGWASRRSEGRDGPTICLGVTLLLWWGPTALALPAMVSHHRGEPHPSWHPFWEWLAQPALSFLAVAGALSALLGLGLAMRRPGDTLRYASPGRALRG